MAMAWLSNREPGEQNIRIDFAAESRQRGLFGVAHDVDTVASKNAKKVAEQWKRTRKPGERGVDVSTTLHSNGSLFDLPMTRTYRFELEDDE